MNENDSEQCSSNLILGKHRAWKIFKKNADFVVVLDETKNGNVLETDLSKAEAPSRSLIMSLVNSKVGPANVKQRQLIMQNFHICTGCKNPEILNTNVPLWTNEKPVGLPMALRAWLSSRLNALIGTSSHTGRTATVERLLAGLVTSALVVILGRLRAEPRRRDDSV